MNGDPSNVETYTASYASSGYRHLGQIIKNDAADRYFMCTLGTSPGVQAEPSWGSATAGQTFSSGSTTWVCLGLISAFTATWAYPHATTETPGATGWISNNYAAPIYVRKESVLARAAAVTYNINNINATSAVRALVVEASPIPPTTASAAKGAKIGTTGANNLSLGGYAAGVSFTEGMYFQAGTGANSASLTVQNSHYHRLRNGKLTLGGTSGGAIVVGVAAQAKYGAFDWEKVDLEFSAINQGVTLNGDVNIKGGALLGTIPTTVFTPTAYGASVVLEDYDLALLTSGKTLVGAPSGGIKVEVVVKSCKLGGGTIMAQPGFAFPNSVAYIVNCSTGDINWYCGKIDSRGIESTETDNVMTGGASDGTTAVSRKIVTSASASVGIPFKSLPMDIWNETVGSAVTVTVFGNHASDVPNNNEVWLELEYLGDPDSPLGTVTESHPAHQYGGSANTSDASTWTSGSGKFKLAVTFTPEQKGPIIARVCAAKASHTFYYDPGPVLS
jgi:hypothetical protein